MTTKSILDVLDILSSPIELAQQAIREENIDKLTNLLSGDEKQKKQPITEEMFVNPQAKENLLHFAVHQSAAICASLLCNAPYSWDVDRPNLIGRTPVHLAQIRGYAPVWYPLAACSRRPPLTGSPDEHIPPHVELRSVSALLIQPQLFVEKPLELEEVFGGQFDSTLGAALALYSSQDEYDEQLSLDNLKLLFELISATPHVSPFLFADQATQPIEGEVVLDEPAVVSHSPDCTNYPACLSQLVRNANARSNPRVIYEAWAFHRFRQAPVDGDSIEAQPAGDSPAHHPYVPLTLLESCRKRIRQVATQKLVEWTKNKAGGADVSCSTYPRLIAQLPLPPIMQTYLAYREWWPAWKRHTMPRRVMSDMLHRRARHQHVFWWPEREDILM